MFLIIFLIKLSIKCQSIQGELFQNFDNCFVLEKNEKEIDELFSVFNKTLSLIAFTSKKEMMNWLFLTLQLNNTRTDFYIYL